MITQNKASLIISVYNRMDYLKFVFAGLSIQSEKNFEIIIADDGSNKESILHLNELSQKYNFNIKHLWHEDKGFRKNKILNKAIIAAESNSLIFIDGDCIPHSKFIEEHIKASNAGICFTGRRVNLSGRITASLSEEKIRNKFLENNSLRLFYDSIFGGTKDPEKGLYFKNNFLRSFFNKKDRGILGCNFSLQKSDLLKINGFDERYEAPSVGEDSDIQFRLELEGIRIKSLNNIAVQYHLYHKLQERPQKNLDLFEEIKIKEESFTPYGIIKQGVNG